MPAARQLVCAPPSTNSPDQALITLTRSSSASTSDRSLVRRCARKLNSRSATSLSPQPDSTAPGDICERSPRPPSCPLFRSNPCKCGPWPVESHPLDEGGTMPTYVSLINWTEKGVAEFKDTVDRAEAGKALAGKFGGALKEIYWTIGRSTTSSPSPRHPTTKPRQRLPLPSHPRATSERQPSARSQATRCAASSPRPDSAPAPALTTIPEQSARSTLPRLGKPRESQYRPHGTPRGQACAHTLDLYERGRGSHAAAAGRAGVACEVGGPSLYRSPGAAREV